MGIPALPNQGQQGTAAAAATSPKLRRSLHSRITNTFTPQLRHDYYINHVRNTGSGSEIAKPVLDAVSSTFDNDYRQASSG
jgi:hypothetical protein